MAKGKPCLARADMQNGISVLPVNCTCIEKAHLSFGFVSIAFRLSPLISMENHELLHLRKRKNEVPLTRPVTGR